VVVVEEGGHGILPTVLGYAMRRAREKTHQIIGGGLPTNAREKI